MADPGILLIQDAQVNISKQRGWWAQQSAFCSTALTQSRRVAVAWTTSYLLSDPPTQPNKATQFGNIGINDGLTRVHVTLRTAPPNHINAITAYEPIQQDSQEFTNLIKGHCFALHKWI